MLTSMKGIINEDVSKEYDVTFHRLNRNPRRFNRRRSSYMYQDFENQTIKPQTGTYTITGILSYAPGHAIYPGMSATKIIPSVSPQPATRTFTELNGQNEKVSFIRFSEFSS